MRPFPENLVRGATNFSQNATKKPPQPSYGGRGADDQIRTDYLVITNDVLYLLSYISARNVHYSELPEQMQALI